MEFINLKSKNAMRAIVTLISIIAVMLGGSFSIHAQKSSVHIKGFVVDFDNGEPVIGATVVIAGQPGGWITDVNGEFDITSPKSEASVEIRSIGYEPLTVTVSSKKRNNIRLRPAAMMLNEVVAVGYGTTTRKDVTGAVSKVNVKDMQKAPVSNFEEALAGRVAGVQSTSSDGQPGSELNIVIRGNNSVTQSNAPLYVVDGFPLETSVGNVLNPEEIESMEILKDASATAIYGARGANGVILITTKKGKVGRPVVTYNVWMGVQNAIKKQEMLDPYEFVRYQLDVNPTLYTSMYLGSEKTLEDYRNERGINWQDKVLRSAFVMNHNISIRGGSEATRYSISGSAVHQDGVIDNSGYRKYQGRLNLEHNISSKVKIGLNLNYTYNKKFGTIAAEQNSSPTASIMYSMWGYRPVGSLWQEDLMNDLYDDSLDPTRDFRINPVMAVKNEYNPTYTYNFISNAYLQYKILPNLLLRISGGYNKIDQRREIFNNSSSRLGHPRTNEKVNGSLTHYERTNFLNENTLTYIFKLKKGHNLKVLGGFTLQDAEYFSDGFTSINIPNEELGIAGLDEGTVTKSPVTKTGNALMSYLARVDYNYKSRYMVTVSYRADGSSKFPKDNRWASFPSTALAWGFGQEQFMKNLTWLTSGKLRFGVGTTGNNRVSDYASLTSLVISPTTGYSVNNSPLKGVVPSSLGNADLKWETTVQYNAGLDLSFLSERINFTADYYYKRTKDLLLKATLAPSMGFLSAYKNVGSVSNSGIELTLNTVNIKTRDFTWDSNFNISFNRNKVLSLNEDEPSLATRVTWGNFNNAYPYIAIPGQPIAMFYGYLFDGIYQYDDFDKVGNTYVLKKGIPNNGNDRNNIQPGDIRYRDINGDGCVDSYDLTIIGNPNPKFIGGFTNNFRYKDFDLSLFLQFSYGGQIMNANRIEFEGGDPTTRTSLNMFSSVKNRWTPENPSNKLFRVGGQGPTAYSNRTIEDGSYLRLKTVTLGYTLPAAITKRAGINSLRVYTAAQNLLTWTGYSGIDPEVSTYDTALTPSFDWSPYPRAKTLTFGLEIGF
ncbi:MAG: TonB-dependent receptor [Duncaniella sp.]|uniref:SusC/RagA family TonB-linked outer membrane protein n=1 Tax=Duncaniella sp. TaxID=2518496 RepID=UPI0023CBC498|nr:TonB-dependent receptor [Duncaniella sp.]MDE5989553.1 TonB-dependent receptor [Duncaniella sp.]